MKAEDYTHRIGRTGRAGRDGLAVTFAEVRDRRKIFDIEAYTRQHFQSETIPGLEPQQRFPEARPGTGASFGGRGNHVADRRPRERSFGGPREGGFGDNRGGLGGRPATGPREFAGNSRDFSGAAREGFSYERKGGFNDRKPAFAKPAGFAKPGNGGKVFVPRDTVKRPAKPAR
jgi:superfamily II DNA/RNA helicase